MVRYLVFGCLLLLCGCGGAVISEAELVTLRIAGSTEMQPMLLALTREYNSQNPHVVFSLRGGGSSLGERWVQMGEVDLAASTAQGPAGSGESVGVGPATSSSSSEALSLNRIPIGLDGIAILVHKDNLVADLTLLQLQQLYSGEALSWKDVGGADDEVLLVSREDGSATRLLFEERVMGDERVALTAVVMPTSLDVVLYVASHTQAIGYVSAGLVGPLEARPDGMVATPRPGAAHEEASEDEGESAAVAGVRIVPVEGVAPEKQALAAQQYHLGRVLFLVRVADLSDPQVAAAQAFIDFVLSPAGQSIVDRFHVRIR